jgi:hypothetical protein
MPQPQARSERKRVVSQLSIVQGLTSRAWASMAHMVTVCAVASQKGALTVTTPSFCTQPVWVP